MDSSTPNGGIVYVLTNDAMPNMIKIGRTSGESVARRLAELSAPTGVPLPFKVEVARTVHDAIAVERALHVAFAPDRVNPRREFFSIAAHRAVALINAFPGEDLTPQTERAVERAVEAAEPGSLAAVRGYSQKRRPPINFLEMGIPLGSALTHPNSGETCVVVEPKKVEFRGEAMSLTRALREITQANYDVQPTGFWTFEGQTLAAIYESTYPRTAE
jgi:hypothetical protein